MTDWIPPKPVPRAEKVSILNHIRLFRRDIFESQPAKLYRAWMAEFRLPFFRSYFCNDPELVDLVLKKRPDDFPKSEIIKGALFSLLGNSVFVTNGALWKKQRRIIDPAFEGGRLRDVFPSIQAAAHDGVARLDQMTGVVEIEEECSRIAADVIFRTLFSIPITDEIATQTFEKFREYQRTQPLMNLGSFLNRPNWIPFLARPETRKTASAVRSLLSQLTHMRGAEIAQGTAPDDLATKIMTMKDPETGDRFSADEMVDQVGIFFLAGHETSASALAWALYLLAMDRDVQAKVATEIRAAGGAQNLGFADLSKLPLTRNVFRETLRLYPPVPMMIRENTAPEVFRERNIKKGSQVVLSPWHLGRHERIWDRPDVFDPYRWETEANRESAQKAYIPFSAGPRVCTGAGFAMIEGVLLLANIVDRFDLRASDLPEPVPVAHLTVRARDGIYVSLSKRD